MKKEKKKKKKGGRKRLYIEATFVKPWIPHRFGNCVSSWAPNFQLWKALLTPSKRQFSSSKKGSTARFRKRGQETPCTSISSWKTTCQWVKWTRIRHIWIEFPLKYSWGTSFKGWNGGGGEESWENAQPRNVWKYFWAVDQQVCIACWPGSRLGPADLCFL